MSRISELFVFRSGVGMKRISLEYSGMKNLNSFV